MRHSREAAEEYSPKRKLWVAARNGSSPEGPKDSFYALTLGVV